MTATTQPLISRYFNQTKDYEDVFRRIRWEKRDAAILGEDGIPVFEQKSVEFPNFWSAQASNIVANKYFRVVNGERENSVAQMINRVVSQISSWGIADGYFEEQDAQVFQGELAFLLLNQMASFNSPVWFNVGVQEKPQSAACYILDVDDSMESIFEWYRTEGMIFKNGSGAGLNISKIRAKGAALSNGGTASGPVSFMRGADTTAGVIKSGGGTRRAAKMVIMDVEHPDIHEFIWCKVLAEQMARDLLNLGYQDGLEGDVRQTIPFQNANNSVSVSDGFMSLATNKVREVGQECGEWFERLQDIAAAAHACGDPGLFFRDTVNKWNTTPGKGEIVSSNPCCEFVRPPNEACNLASLNLLKFLQDDGSFDIDSFQQAVRVMITAMDILVDRSSYPTDAIAQNSHDYRSLGLGYANLGALLMAKGLPYDSDQGRSYAAAITALLTGAAYAQSGKIAEKLGAFSGFTRDAAAMQGVIQQHYTAALDATHKDYADAKYIIQMSLRHWERASYSGLRAGFRNCQVTLLAPTGTISFMMDCDTTGIEPDTALIKEKKLVGGGKVRLVNQTVARALDALKYLPATRNTILGALENTGSLTYSVANGLLAKKDLPVFQTALGDNALPWKAHIKMVAAVQPFLSGAVSKTINMPSSSTVDDVRQAFSMAWELGLKSVAVYVDGSKSVQPVTTVKVSTQDGQTADPRELTIKSLAKEVLEDSTKTFFKPQRNRLPNERPAVNHKFVIGQHEGYLNVGLYPDTGMPGELFIHMSKEGSTVSGLMDTVGILTSLLLQYGVPLEVITNKLRHARFEPSGFTGYEPVPYAHSPIDYIFRWLAHKYTNGAEDNERVELGAIAAQHSASTLDAPLCAECGMSMTRRAGSCYVCDSCGSSSGCS